MTFKKRIIVKIFILLLISFANFVQLLADSVLYDNVNEGGDTIRPKYIFGIGYGLNSFNSNFTQLPNVGNCCPKFLDGTGGGLNFNLGYEIPIFKSAIDGLALGFNMAMINRSGGFEISETTQITDGVDLITGEFKHSLDLSLTYLDLMPYLSYQITNSLSFSAGVGIATNISNDYQQKEQLSQPSNKGYFIDSVNGTKSRVRNEKSGKIENLNSLIFANIGLGYELPLNSTNTLRLKPSVNYNIGFNDAVKDLDFKIKTIQFALNAVYTPFETIKKETNNYNIDTIKVESDKIDQNIVKLGKYNIETEKIEKEYYSETINNYSRTDTFLIAKAKPVVKETTKQEPIVDKKPEAKKIEPINEITGSLEILNPKSKNDKITQIKAQIEFVKDVYPLLPYIFFDELSPKLPKRYKQVKKSEEFDLKDLDPNPIDYHKNNLNIIGFRLAQNPQIKLVVKGYIDPTTEANNCELAKLRAQNVKDYLVNVFEIEESRISIKTNTNNCFPTDITRSQSDEGYSENRRVELETNIPELLFSLSNQRYQRPSQLLPDEVIISPKFENVTIDKNSKEILSRNKFINWSYYVELDGTEVSSESEDSDLRDINYILPYKLIRDAKNDSKLTFGFTANDVNGDNISDSKILALTKDTSNLEIESLTLTVFQVSQYSLDDRIKKEIRKFFDKIGEGASVYIKGYSDNLGVLSDNKRLSQTRANAVRDYIKSIAPKVKIIEAVGVGSDEFPPGVRGYMTPEERFISRTVQIEIRKEFDKE